MGMFDYIVCNYPLPGLPEFVKPGHQFQTKDTEPQWMETHTIAEDGAFSIAGFSGLIDFYTTNIAGSYGRAIYTSKGEDAESVTYNALFENGRLVRVVQTESINVPALPASRMRSAKYAVPSKEERRAWNERVQRLRAGSTIYVEFGSLSGRRGYTAQVLAESPEEMACRVIESDDPHAKVGTFVVIKRLDFGRTWADDKACIDERHESRTAEFNAAMAEYDALCESRKSPTPTERSGDEQVRP